MYFSKELATMTIEYFKCREGLNVEDPFGSSHTIATIGQVGNCNSVKLL